MPAISCCNVSYGRRAALAISQTTSINKENTLGISRTGNKSRTIETDATVAGYSLAWISSKNKSIDIPLQNTTQRS
jgi:hypothetical protein